jgi:hypothetical protein
MSDDIAFRNPLKHDSAEDGTAYWTISLYISAERVEELYRLAGVIDPAERRKYENLAYWQINHWPSFALRNAVEPLFNDIADRDVQGRPQDFLFAAGLGRKNPRTDLPWASVAEGATALLDELELDVRSPSDFSWTTEGIEFQCHLAESPIRRLVLRRFWFAHNDGALSYHLSFSHCYGDNYGLSTYYFLSLMQKLLAPKEFRLKDELLEVVAREGGKRFSPFDKVDLGIDPIDGIEIAPAIDEEPREESFTKDRGNRFWPFVRKMFTSDAALLFAEILCDPDHLAPSAAKNVEAGPKGDKVDLGKLADREWFVSGEGRDQIAPTSVPPEILEALIEQVDFLEVPGLRLPRCRYLFHIQDNRFFDRLLPLDPVSGESLPRKRCVQDICYKPYHDKIDALIKAARQMDRPQVHLGRPNESADPESFLDWNWVTERTEYQELLEKGWFEERREGETPRGLTTIEALSLAAQNGHAFQLFDEDGFELQPPRRLHIPTFAPGRSDCLDYLFLSGFNQNIIDFMNQDTSEILDSTDPIYPTVDLEADERFFVRYANQRGMVSYVSRSRSLEIGNDYIGTCPYAFLIHALAMHNEYLARDHERRSNEGLVEIDREVRAIEEDGHRAKDAAQRTLLGVRSREVERKINALKHINFWSYERHRYQHVFRYDTEAKVFQTLEELRGVDRRAKSLSTALEALEDFADDLDRRQKDAARAADEAAREAEARRGEGVRLVLGALGVVSTAGLLFTLGDYFEKHPNWLFASSHPDYSLGSLAGNLAWFITIGGLSLIVGLTFRHRKSIVRLSKEAWRIEDKRAEQNPH